MEGRKEEHGEVEEEGGGGIVSRLCSFHAR